MKIKKIKLNDLLNVFSKLKISYFSFGTLETIDESGRKRKTHDFFKTDLLTEEKKRALKEIFPSIEFFISGSNIAPEIKRAIIASPKAYLIKKLNK